MDEYSRYYSPALGKLKSGRNGAPLIRLEAERDRLQGELLSAEGLLQQFETESSRIEQLRATEVAEFAQRNELATRLEGLRAAAEQYTKLSSERKERIAQRDGAQARHKTFSERIQTIARMRSQIATYERSLGDRKAEIPTLAAQAEERQKFAKQADDTRAHAEAAEEAARVLLETARSADQYVRTVMERDEISRRLDDFTATQQVIQLAIEAKAAVKAPTEAQLLELRASLAQETDARRRLDLARITVDFVPETRIKVHVSNGEQPGTIVCEPGERVVLPGAPNLAFTIEGIGRLEASGPVADYESIRRALGQRRNWIGAFAAQFGTADPEVLESRRREMAELDTKVRNAQDNVSRLLAGHTEPGLRQRYAELSTCIKSFEDAHPGWSSQLPAATQMLAAANAALTDSATTRNKAENAARAVQAELAESQSRLNIAIAGRTTLRHQLEQAQLILDGCLSDNLSDEHRQTALDEAALEYDGCRVKLEYIEIELKRFTEDPLIAIGRISVEMTKAEDQANKTKEERLRAETRIQGLVERRPYAAASEVSESVAVIREQIAREDRRMKAFALLRKTLDEARGEMMLAVSAPVERIATDYLEEICGKPVAEIRLSQSLATERVIPAALADGTVPDIELERLSGGEREQIFLCTRIALGSELARRERQLVVLDDVLTYTDDERMGRICRLLAKVSERLQLVILTCHPERFSELPEANRIDLLAALGREAVGAHV
jgi:hypothetical protein